jgi:hypothetical protein
LLTEFNKILDAGRDDWDFDNLNIILKIGKKYCILKRNVIKLIGEQSCFYDLTLHSWQQEVILFVFVCYEYGIGATWL